MYCINNNSRANKVTFTSAIMERSCPFKTLKIILIIILTLDLILIAILILLPLIATPISIISREQKPALGYTCYEFGDTHGLELNLVIVSILFLYTILWDNNSMLFYGISLVISMEIFFL